MTKSYEEAIHAVQAGVATEQGLDAREQGAEWHDKQHKHLRVGIDSALCNDAALVRVLVDKGVLTWVEYHKAVTAEMNREVERYESRLSARLNTKVDLH